MEEIKSSARESKRRSKTQKTRDDNFDEKIHAVADISQEGSQLQCNGAAVADPRQVSDRLNYMRMPEQMTKFGMLEPHQFDSLKWMAALD